MMRLDGINPLDIFPALSASTAYSLLAPPSLVPIDCLSTIEHLHAFFSALIHGYFGGIQSPPFKALLCRITGIHKLMYVVACLGVFLQLSCKTGRLKVVFSVLRWLSKLFKDSETYKQTFTQINFSSGPGNDGSGSQATVPAEDALYGFKRCLSLLRENAYLNRRQLRILGIVDFSSPQPPPQTSNDHILSLASHLVRACLVLLTEATSSQILLWSTYLKTNHTTERDLQHFQSCAYQVYLLRKGSLPREIHFHTNPSKDIAWRGIPPVGVMAVDGGDGWVYSVDYVDRGDVVTFIQVVDSASPSPAASTTPSLRYQRCVPQMDRKAGYCVCPQTYQTSHRIAHLASQAHSRYVAVVTACNRLFVWEAPENVEEFPLSGMDTGGEDTQKIANRQRLSSLGETMSLRAKDDAAILDNTAPRQTSLVSSAIGRIASMLTNITSPASRGLIDKDLDSAPSWPSMEVDLREWYTRRQYSNHFYRDSCLTPRILKLHLLSGSPPRLVMATLTVGVLVCRIVFATSQLHLLYRLPSPQALDCAVAEGEVTADDFRVAAISSSTALDGIVVVLWQYDLPTQMALWTSTVGVEGSTEVLDCGKLYSRMNPAYSKLIRPPVPKSIIAIYRQDELVDEVYSFRSITQVVCVAELIGALSVDGEVFVCADLSISSNLESASLPPGASLTRAHPTTWVKLEHSNGLSIRAGWISTTFPESEESLLSEAFQAPRVRSRPPGIIVSVCPKSGSRCAGGSIVCVSAVDGSMEMLDWIDNSMPGGLLGLEFVGPSACVVYHQTPPIWSKVSATGASPPPPPHLPMLHPLVCEVSIEVIDFLLSAIDPINWSSHDDDCADALCAIELLTLHLLVADSRKFIISSELSERTLRLLSLVLKRTPESSKLHTAARRCIVSGWPLMAPRTTASLLVALESQLVAVGERNIMVLDLLLSSILTHFGIETEGDKQEDVGLRLHRTLIEQFRQYSDRSSEDKPFSLLSHLTAELFAEALSKLNPTQPEELSLCKPCLPSATVERLLKFTLAAQDELTNLVAVLLRRPKQPVEPSSPTIDDSDPSLKAALHVLATHCRQVRSEARGLLQRLSDSPDAASISVLLQCHGLTQCLPHLSHGLAWLYSEVFKEGVVESGQGHLLKLLLEMELPRLLCEDLLRPLDDLNCLCKGADARDIDALFMNSKQAKHWREWTRLTSKHPNDFLKPARDESPDSHCVVINDLVYDVKGLQETFPELLPIIDLKGLDVSTAYRTLNLSLEARRSLAARCLGPVEHNAPIDLPAQLYDVEASLVVCYMQWIESLFNVSIPDSCPNALLYFPSFKTYRHNLHRIPCPFVEAFIEGQNLPLKHYIIGRLPFPRLKNEQELKALEECVVYAAAAMFYHTGTLQFFLTEAMAVEPDLSGVKRYIPVLSRFILKLIYLHQSGALYVDLLSDIRERCRLLCTHLEPIVFSHGITVASSDVHHQGSGGTEQDRDIDESSCRSASASSAPVPSTVRTAAFAPPPPPPPPSKWHWAYQRLRSRMSRPESFHLWSGLFAALVDSRSRAYLSWLHGKSDPSDIFGKTIEDISRFCLDTSLDLKAVDTVVNTESQFLEETFSLWKKGLKHLEWVLPVLCTKAPTPSPRPLMPGISLLAATRLLATNSGRPHLFDDKISKVLECHLPSQLEQSFVAARGDFVANLLQRLRDLLIKAEDFLIASICSNTPKPFCLEDFINTKEIVLLLQCLSEMLVQIGSLDSPTLALHRASFFALLQKLEKLTTGGLPRRGGKSSLRPFVERISSRFVLTVVSSSTMLQPRLYTAALQMLVARLHMWNTVDGIHVSEF
uniref:RICTOR_N domain-containing protein n=1 Tax=Mesocestoides corti TaxID=53468 RepID=A0A5K3FI31_MESCO